MEPMTMMIAGQMISGLAQAYTSEKARGASAAELAKIKELYEGIIPPDYDVSIDAPPRFHKEAIASPKFQAALQSPSFDMSKFTPQNLEQVGKYAPQLAPLIKEAAPTLIQNSETMTKGRAAQTKALERLTKIGEGGFDPEYAQKVDEAGRSAQQEAQSRQSSLMDSFARRGVGGSGLELAAAMGSNAQAMDRSAMANQQAATDAYRNQLSALSQGAELGGNMFSQDANLQETNANIINQFNQRMSTAQQAWEKQRADQMNEAQVRNLAEKQRIADSNVGMANDAEMANRSRIDDLSKFNYNAQVGQQGRSDDLAKFKYNSAVDERGYQDNIAKYLAEWKAGQKKNQNAIKSQQYGDQMSRASGLAGMYQGNANNILSAAGDRNSAISGIAGAATNMGMNYQQKEDSKIARQEDRDFQERMAKNYGYQPGAYVKG